MSFFILVLFLQPVILYGGTAQDHSDWGSVKNVPTAAGISVETKDGKKVNGKLGSVTDTALTLTHKGTLESVDKSNIKKIFRTDGGSMGKSIAIFSAIGLGVGGATGAAVLGATGGSDDTAGVLAPFLLVGAGIGAGIGAALGRHKRVLIYESK